MGITTCPLAWDSPAARAASFPKFLDKFTSLKLLELFKRVSISRSV
ncbi:hypothetical protein TA5113_02542 [Cognatishimia activa]|nr:hypothetical protein TA5113_02542 [Cognatishimia activa]